MKEMKAPLSMSTQPGGNPATSDYLRDPKLDAFRPGGLIARWYRLTSPPEPPTEASYRQRDIYRRGQLASTIMLVLAGVLCLVIPIGLLGPNKQILIVVLVLLVLIAICAPINRKGKVNTAGLILSLSLNLGICSSIIRSPGGLAPDTIALFDLLVFSELFVASLLPVNWVWASALFNIVFSFVELTYAPRTPLFATIMAHSYYTIVSRPIQLHLLVTVVLFLWVSNATRAIKRADRAEVIASLQHNLANLEHAEVEQKRRLEWSIGRVVETLTQWNNGNIGVRIPLTQENVLWQVAGSINNLLNRVQRSRQEAENLQRMNGAIARFYEARAKSNGDAILDWPITNTPVDILVKQHNVNLQRMNGAIARFYEARTKSNGGAILDWSMTNTPIDILVKQHNTQAQLGVESGRMADRSVPQRPMRSTIQPPHLQSLDEERPDWRTHR